MQMMPAASALVLTMAALLVLLLVGPTGAVLSSVTKKEAIHKFKAADVTGDCVLTYSEFFDYFDNILLSKLMNLLGAAHLSPVIQATTNLMLKSYFDKLSTNYTGTKGSRMMTPAKFDAWLDNWTCTPAIVAADPSAAGRRLLIGRSAGAECANMCSGKDLTCCSNTCITGSSCGSGSGGGHAAYDIVSILPVLLLL